MELTGLRLDNKHDGTIAGAWAYAKNILLGKGYKQIDVELGSTQYFDAGSSEIVQILAVPNGHILFTNTNGTGSIKFVNNNGNVKTIISSTLLDFTKQSTYTLKNPSIKIIKKDTGYYWAVVTYIDPHNLVTGTNAGIAGMYIKEIDTETGQSNTFSINPYRAITVIDEYSWEYILTELDGTYENVLISYIYPYYNPQPTLNRYIDAVYQYNNNNELIIAWTDGIVPPMILNTSNVPSPFTTIEQLYLFPPFQHCDIQFKGLIDGGDLKNGCYFVSVCYEVERGIYTNFGIISNPIFVFNNLNNILNNLIIEVGANSEQSIILELSRLDTKYKFIKIGVIYQTSTTLVAFQTPRIEITNHNRLQYVISDVDKLEIIDINTILITNPSFNTVQTLTKSNNRLRLGNLSKFPKDTLANQYDQRIANIRLNWVCVDRAKLAYTTDSYSDPIFIFDKRTFMFDEVYAFYLAKRSKFGGYHAIYHIPGRPSVSSDFDEVSIDGVKYPKFKITSTATKTYDPSIDQKGVGLISGEFGYWQNEDETYDNRYGTTLGNSKVRHHRFPSIKQINEWKIGGLITKKVYTQGEDPDNNVLATNFRFADRTPSNTTVVLNCTLTSLPAGLVFTNDNEEGDLNAAGMRFSMDRDSEFVYPITGKIKITAGMHIMGRFGIIARDSYISYTEVDITNGQSFEFDVNLNIGRDDDFAVNVVLYGIDYPGGIPDINYLKSKLTIDPSTYLSIKKFDKPSINSSDIELSQYILGVKINGIISDIFGEDDEVVDGYELLYAKRTLNDSLIVDRGICLSSPNATVSRFYGADSITNKLKLDADFIRSHLNLWGYFIGTSPDAVDVIRGIKSITYMPQYNSATVPTNANRENHYRIQHSMYNFDQHFVELIKIKNNLYLDFGRYELVSTGKILKKRSVVGGYSITFVESKNGILYLSTYPEYHNVQVGSLLNKDFTLWIDENTTYPLPEFTKIVEIRDEYIFGIDSNLVPPNPKTLSLGDDSLKEVPLIYGGDTVVSNFTILYYTSKTIVWNRISSLTYSEGIVTVTLYSHDPNSNDPDYLVQGLNVGDTIIVSGVSPTNSDFNGTFKIAEILDTTGVGKFTYATESSETIAITQATTIVVYTPNTLAFPTQSITNQWLRSSSQSDSNKFFPLNANRALIETVEIINNIRRLKYITAMKEANVANDIIYDMTWNLINILKSVDIDTPNSNNIRFYTNRIYSTQEQPLDSVSSFWRSIRTLDYIDVPNDKGSIVKLSGHNKILYIRCKYGLKRGITNDTLKVIDANIALKTTDIFDAPIEDVFDAPDLYINNFGKTDTLFTPYGLVLVDLVQGSVYLVSDNINKISSIGVENWLKARLQGSTFDAKPDYRGKGIILGYDDYNKRLLLTIKNNNTSTLPNFTLSYNFDTNFWVSFHSYIPDQYVPNGVGMFYAKDNKIFKLGTANSQYYETGYQDALIDFIFADNTKRPVLLNAVSWVSNVGIMWDKLMSSIAIYTKTRNTGYINLLKHSVTYDNNQKLVVTGNTKYLNGRWIFNDIKDLVLDPNSAIITDDGVFTNNLATTQKEWYQKSKFISNNFIVRFLFKSTDNIGLTKNISDVQIHTKQSL